MTKYLNARSIAACAVLGLAGLLAAIPTTGVASAGSTAEAPVYAGASPIKHVVVILQENHSFDNVLGKFCPEVADGQITRPGSDSTCNGATTGELADGKVIPLAQSPDFVTASQHTVQSQVADINGGKMNGFDLIAPCKETPDSCYQQFDPLSGPCKTGDGSCIPNLAALASKYTVSDDTFELYQSPSWAGHLYFVTANQDGFEGDNPHHSNTGPQPVRIGPGWGCDSGSTTFWADSHGKKALIPSCVPNAAGSLGPNWTGYTGPKAGYLPTIFDELDADKLSWKIYGGQGSPDANTRNFQSSGWQWAICPTFAECLYSTQKNSLVAASQIQADAKVGTLPSFSILTPTTVDSQHNGFSMSQGDDYIGQVVSAIQSGPDWASTAIFITYDDCGCFYDHVNPLQFNSQWGVRVPMVIVSPYSKLGYTDSNPATFAGILAFTEATFGLAALNSTDASAYDYSGSFCFNPKVAKCTPAGLASLPMVDQPFACPTPAQLANQEIEAAQDT